MTEPSTYIEAGKRCAIVASKWRPEWWVSHSPRNGPDPQAGPVPMSHSHPR